MVRKQHETESKRQFIVDAAEGLFRERGIDEPSMDDLAAAAEYTRQTLYAYFKSRDEILLRVFTRELRQRWSRQQAALVGVEGCVESLRGWATELVDYWRENPHAMRMEMFWDYYGIDVESVGSEAMAEFVDLNEELAAHLRVTLERGIQDGSLRRDLDVDMCASQFLQCLRAAAYRALSDSYSFASFDSESYLELFLEIFFAGIRAQPTPRKGSSS